MTEAIGGSKHKSRGKGLFAACKSAAARLIAETDCDSVIVLATKHTENRTICYDYSQGNYFARLGHLRTYLTRMEESERIQTRIEME